MTASKQAAFGDGTDLGPCVTLVEGDLAHGQLLVRLRAVRGEDERHLLYEDSQV